MHYLLWLYGKIDRFLIKGFTEVNKMERRLRNLSIKRVKDVDWNGTGVYAWTHNLVCRSNC